MSDRSGVSPLLGQVAKGLCASLRDPRRVAEELIRKELGVNSAFMGEGTQDCPWVVFGHSDGFYAFYLRDQELVQIVNGRPDEVVRNL
jgi:hypothetical protein